MTDTPPPPDRDGRAWLAAAGRRPVGTPDGRWWGMWAGRPYESPGDDWTTLAHLLPDEFERLWVLRTGGPWHKAPGEVVAGAAAWFDGLAPETRDRLWEQAPAALLRVMGCEIAAL